MTDRLRYRLRPLRVQTGWRVEWNTFFDIEPAELPEDETGVLADLLQLVNERMGRLIDLGWSGLPRRYQLIMLQRDSEMDSSKWQWESPIRTFETTLTAEAAEMIDRWMEELA